MMVIIWSLELFLVILFITFGCCLRLLELSVPELVDIRDSAILHCKFDLEGAGLYSVKWYKEELEFFRYMPDSPPQIQTFQVDGIYLLESGCNMTTVVLSPLSYSTSGAYKCEVSTEAPHFKIVYRQANLTVLGLPKEEPLVTGIQPTYAVGNYVVANCTSAPSNPPAQIEWSINGAKAEQWLLFYYHSPKVKDNLGLETRTVGIRFQVDNGHFVKKEGILTLACTATVAGITRTKELKSYLAKLMNEKFAQEKLLNEASKYRHLKWWTLVFIISLIIL